MKNKLDEAVETLNKIKATCIELGKNTEDQEDKQYYWWIYRNACQAITSINLINSDALVKLAELGVGEPPLVKTGQGEYTKTWGGK